MPRSKLFLLALLSAIAFSTATLAQGGGGSGGGGGGAGAAGGGAAGTGSAGTGATNSGSGNKRKIEFERIVC